MIVKTGANYQAEGGYIEASYAENRVITVKKNNVAVFSIGYDEENGAVVEVELTNDTPRNLSPVAFFDVGSLKDVYGTTMTSVIGANSTGTFKTLALMNLPQRFSYSGDFINNLALESEYIEMEVSGGYCALKIVKMPPAGEKITARLYVAEG